MWPHYFNLEQLDDVQSPTQDAQCVEETSFDGVSASDWCDQIWEERSITEKEYLGRDAALVELREIPAQCTYRPHIYHRMDRAPRKEGTLLLACRLEHIGIEQVLENQEHTSHLRNVQCSSIG